MTNGMQDALIAELNKLDDRSLTKTGEHVYEVWWDGEVTLTKGGDLYRQRGMHMQMPPFPYTVLEKEMLGKDGSIAVPDKEVVKQARKLIAEAAMKSIEVMHNIYS